MKTSPLINNTSDIDAATTAAKCVVEVHVALTEFLRAGLTLPEIDFFVAKTLRSLGCKSAFYKYSVSGQPPFPSQSCISVNDCIVHGTHTMKHAPLQSGDLISIDIGSKYQGWIGDAAWTWAIDHCSDENMQLMQAGKESLAAGILVMQTGKPLLDFAKAVQYVAETQYKFHLVRGLGGHGYGQTLHCPPYIANSVPAHPSEWPDATRLFEEGMLLAVEPMISVGTPEIKHARGTWPIYSADQSMSVHYEADVFITADGPVDLTQGLQELPCIVGNST